MLELRKLIETADGILFCTPEYIFSLPGSLKNLIEWNVSTVLFSNKPMAMIVAAASGEKNFESLDLILTSLELSLPHSSKLLISGAKRKITARGNIEDKEIVSILDLLISWLVATIKDEDRKPTKYEI